jgi:glutathione synthase/RimK-type ligase-like ATP-grasp enzyme
MGCYAVNSGDALDRVREPLAVLQELSRAGLPIDTGAGPTDLAASDAAGPPPAVTLCAIVVGGRVVVTVRRRQGRTTMPARKVAPAVTNLAAKAAGVLRLGLAAVDILRDPDRPEPAAITAVSAVPDLSRIERISGVDVAREIVDLIEQRVRSRVTAVDLAE